MASQTLRPHRSPSPSPGPNPSLVNPANPAKLTRQSLGPPPSSTGAAKGFGGVSLNSPRHVSSGAFGSAQAQRESMTRPPIGQARVPSGGRPSSEFIPSGIRETKTPEAEQIDQWFKHLASWEQTLEEMAAASTDQNFTEELGAIEQWFRVLSEAERTAALYSLLQHSTPVQIRFFQSVLHHMAQSDPMAALLSPNPNQAGFGAQLDRLSGMKSPSAGGGTGFTGSPGAGSYLVAEDQKAKLRANRISAPGTLQPTDRWQSQLDHVSERGPSPDNLSSRSRSPAPDSRPKSEAFANKAKDTKSPRPSVGLGIEAPLSPIPHNPSWASMVNTPVVPGFVDPKLDGMGSALNFANVQLAANQSRIALEDARQYRRGNTSRNVSNNYDEVDAPQARTASPLLNQYNRSPVLDQFGSYLDTSLAGLGMNLANLGLNPIQANAAQMLALAQVQQQYNNTAASFATAGYGGQPNLNNSRGHLGTNGNNNMNGSRPPAGRRSPMMNRQSPQPQSQTKDGGAYGGAGVAGPNDVDPRIIEDVGGWLRVLRLHKYNTTFEKSTWQEMVAMDDKALQAKGIAAQGARTKFLKVFWNVREHKGMPHPPGQDEYAHVAQDESK